MADPYTVTENLAILRRALLRQHRALLNIVASKPKLTPQTVARLPVVLDKIEAWVNDIQWDAADWQTGDDVYVEAWNLLADIEGAVFHRKYPKLKPLKVTP